MEREIQVLNPKCLREKEGQCPANGTTALFSACAESSSALSSPERRDWAMLWHWGLAWCIKPSEGLKAAWKSFSMQPHRFPSESLRKWDEASIRLSTTDGAHKGWHQPRSVPGRGSVRGLPPIGSRECPCTGSKPPFFPETKASGHKEGQGRPCGFAQPGHSRCDPSCAKPGPSHSARFPSKRPLKRPRWPYFY